MSFNGHQAILYQKAHACIEHFQNIMLNILGNNIVTQKSICLIYCLDQVKKISSE